MTEKKKDEAPEVAPQAEADAKAAKAAEPVGDTAPSEASAVSDVEPTKFKVKFEDGVTVEVEAVYAARAESAARDRLRQIADGEAEVDAVKSKK